MSTESAPNLAICSQENHSTSSFLTNSAVLTDITPGLSLSLPPTSEKPTLTLLDNGSDDETDLTNLTWLTELRNQNLSWPSVVDKCSNGEVQVNTSTDKVNQQQPSFSILAQTKRKSYKFGKLLQTIQLKNGPEPNTLNVSNDLQNDFPVSTSSIQKRSSHQQQAQPTFPTPSQRYEIFLDKIKRDLMEYKKFATNYQNDTVEKPPFNYSHIIGMAMLENGRVTLQQICTWIESKFAFFRVRKKWNNSIRHNLSLHYCFRKIDRNKYEKGKGGYWELGVDPKKCDRKRIRNRKSVQSKMIGIRTNKNFSSSTKSRSAVRNSEKSKYCCDLTGNVKNMAQPLFDAHAIAASAEPNELLVNEMHVQHGNVNSCSDPHHQNLNDVFITGVLSNSAVEDTTSSSEICTSNSISNLQHHMQEQLDDEFRQEEQNCQQLQKYQLGTIIISTSTTDVEQASSTINNIFGENNNEQHQSLVLSNNAMLPRCGNIIISSYLANNNVESNRNNFNESLTNQRTCRPNVIVEQAAHPSFGTLSSLASSITSTSEAIPHMEYSSVISDSFRPYIDGIEEAFQYLRSIDNSNREDILDNLLDISVSDY